MRPNVLKFLNFLTALVIIFILSVCLLFVPIATGLGLTTGFFLFWFVVYINVNNSITDFIDSRKKANLIKTDVRREKRVSVLRFILIFAGLFGGISYSILELLTGGLYAFLTAILLTLIIILMVLFLNVFLSVNYLVTGKILVIRADLVILPVILCSIIAFAWFYLSHEQLFDAVILLVLITLLFFVYYTARRAIAVLKAMNTKPADPQRDQRRKLISFGGIVALIVIILLLRYLPSPYYMFSMLELTFMALFAFNIRTFLTDMA